MRGWRRRSLVGLFVFCFTGGSHAVASPVDQSCEELGEVKEELRAVRAKLGENTKTLSTLVEKVDAVLSKAKLNRPQRPRGPDPEKVYSFPVGHSPVLGPEDALVTIIEISEFQ